MDKKIFRQRQLANLKVFATTAQKEHEDEQLLERILGWEELINAETVGLTWSLEFEVNTWPLIQQFWLMEKEVYLPTANQDKSMDFKLFSDRSDLGFSRFGVGEVMSAKTRINNQLDLIIVPGLAYSGKNDRLGFGGGFYDRFLARHLGIKTVTLANSQMFYQNTEWAVEKTDIPVQTIITPEDFYYL